MHKHLFCLLLIISASLPIFGAEPTLRIPMSIRSIKSDGGTETKGPIVGLPIANFPNGQSVELRVGDLAFGLLATTIESESSVRVFLTERKPATAATAASVSTVIKRGEKGVVRLSNYEVELTPTWFIEGINVEFPGGTLDQLVAKLSQNEKRPFNLVKDKPDLTFNLPPFAVRNASPSDFAAALNLLLGSQGASVSAMRSGDQFEPVFYLKSVASDAGQSDFACRDLSAYLDPVKPPSGSVSPASARHKPYTVDEIVKLLTDACQFRLPNMPADHFRVRFHPETKLLFITGQAEAVHTAIRTLDALPKPVNLF